MISFINDYSVMAHPDVLEAINKFNGEFNYPYSGDKHTENAIELIREKINNKDAFIQIVSTGTQANLLAAAAFLRPHEALMGVKTAHVMVHETGAIEAVGHKCIEVEGRDGKIWPEDIEKVCAPHNWDHAGILIVKPRMVFISQTTEVGTVYTKKELEDLRKTCDKFGLLLYCDGARLASSLSCSDVTLEDLARLCDAFYIGGGKSGALLGEAIVIINDNLKEDFKYIAKQRGAMLAKGYIYGVQFEVLMKNNLYENIGIHMNKMADIMREGLRKNNIELTFEGESNQIFAIFENDLLDKLSEEFAWEVINKIDSNNTEIRLVNSWYTKEEEVNYFIEKLSELKNNR